MSSRAREPFGVWASIRWRHSSNFVEQFETAELTSSRTTKYGSSIDISHLSKSSESLSDIHPPVRMQRNKTIKLEGWVYFCFEIGDLGKTRERGHGEVITGSNPVTFIWTCTTLKFPIILPILELWRFFSKAAKLCVVDTDFRPSWTKNYCRSEDSNGGAHYARSSTRVGTPPSKKTQFVLKKLLGFE